MLQRTSGYPPLQIPLIVACIASNSSACSFCFFHCSSVARSVSWVLSLQVLADKAVGGRRGPVWQAALHSQELFKSLQRHYSNTITDADKQDAINL